MQKHCMLTAVFILSGCTYPEPPAPDAGMANPASIYCIHAGGKLSMETSDGGVTGYCTLPSGEHIEEWTLYHRNIGD